MSDIQNRKKVTKPPQRHFLGKTENFAQKTERHFFQRMLKAYLAGKKEFSFGYDLFKHPKRHLVMQSGGIGV